MLAQQIEQHETHETFLEPRSCMLAAVPQFSCEFKKFRTMCVHREVCIVRITQRPFHVFFSVGDRKSRRPH